MTKLSYLFLRYLEQMHRSASASDTSIADTSIANTAGHARSAGISDTSISDTSISDTNDFIPPSNVIEELKNRPLIWGRLNQTDKTREKIDLLLENNKECFICEPGLPYYLKIDQDKNLFVRINGQKTMIKASDTNANSRNEYINPRFLKSTVSGVINNEEFSKLYLTNSENYKKSALNKYIASKRLEIALWELHSSSNMIN